MNEKKEVVQKNNQKNVQLPAQNQVGSENFLNHAFDKTIDAAGKEIDKMEKDKPGTRRKLAGIASIAIGIGVGAGGIGSGIYLLTT